MRFVVLLVGVVGMAALVVGCGSGDGETTTTSTNADSALSNAAFKKQADGICKELLADAEADMLAWSKSGEKNAKGEQTNADGETASEIMRRYYETKSDQLQELTPPEAQQERFEKMLTALDDVLEEGRKTPEIFVSGSESLEKMGLFASQLGLECSS